MALIQKKTSRTMKVRGGLSKIVGTVLLMLVTVSMGVVLYAYMQNKTSSSMGNTLPQVRVGFATIEKYFWRGDLVVYVANHGDQELKLDKAYLRVGNEWVAVKSSLPTSIPPHSSKAVIVSTVNISPGNHELRLAGPSGYVGSIVDPPGSAILDYIGTITPAATINSPIMPASGFLAKFYDIRGLEQVPSVDEILGLGDDRLLDERVVQQIRFSDTVSGLPRWGLPQTDRFAAVFEGVVSVKEKSILKITAVSDDGVYITVDGKVVINGWRLQAATRYEGSITLSPGNHEVVVVYFENYGIATLEVSLDLVPVTQNAFSVISITGKYYDTTDYNPSSPDYRKVLNDELPTKFFEDTEQAIDYTDHSAYGGKPWPFTNTYRDVNCFATHWVVKVQVNVPGMYEVNAISDDGIVILLDNNKQVISDWTLHGPRQYTQVIYLSKGTHRFDIAYYENYGIARAYFNLSFVGNTNQVVSEGWEAVVYDLTHYTWGSLNLNELYDNIILGKFPVVGKYRVDYIDFTDHAVYGGSPWFFSGHGTDYFAVVFKTTINVKDYIVLNINVYTDDGTKVLVDGNVVLDAWRLQSPHHYSVGIALAPGSHEIAVVYFERTGIARLKVDLYPSAPVYAGRKNVFTLVINDPSAVPKDFRITLINEKGVIGEKEVHIAGTSKQVITIEVKGDSLPARGAIVIWGGRK